jgi:hypothetical protein
MIAMWRVVASNLIATTEPSRMPSTLTRYSADNLTISLSVVRRSYGGSGASDGSIRPSEVATP